MTTYEEALQIMDKLSVVEKVKLMEHLSASLKHDLEHEAFKNMPWQQFIDATYGILADDPIERNQPLHPDIRDEIE